MVCTPIPAAASSRAASPPPPPPTPPPPLDGPRHLGHADVCLRGGWQRHGCLQMVRHDAEHAVEDARGPLSLSSWHGTGPGPRFQYVGTLRWLMVHEQQNGLFVSIHLSFAPRPCMIFSPYRSRRIHSSKKTLGTAENSPIQTYTSTRSTCANHEL